MQEKGIFHTKKLQETFVETVAKVENTDGRIANEPLKAKNGKTFSTTFFSIQQIEEYK